MGALGSDRRARERRGHQRAPGTPRAPRACFQSVKLLGAHCSQGSATRPWALDALMVSGLPGLPAHAFSLSNFWERLGATGEPGSAGVVKEHQGAPGSTRERPGLAPQEHPLSVRAPVLLQLETLAQMCHSGPRAPERASTTARGESMRAPVPLELWGVCPGAPTAPQGALKSTSKVQGGSVRGALAHRLCDFGTYCLWGGI